MVLLRSLLFNAAWMGWTAVLAILYLPLLAAPRRVLVACTRFWTKGILWCARTIAGLEHDVRGLENLPEGPVVIAAKHQSAWDTLIWHSLVDDPVFVLKKELLSIPLIGWYMRKADMIAIDRKAGAAAMRRMMRQAEQALAEGRQIVVFPEGTRTAPGATRPYQPGISMLYGGTGAPVVPAALNSGLFWPRQSFLKQPGRITLEILPPMPKGLGKREFVSELSRRIEEAAAKLCRESAPTDARHA